MMMMILIIIHVSNSYICIRKFVMRGTLCGSLMRQIQLFLTIFIRDVFLKLIFNVSELCAFIKMCTPNCDMILNKLFYLLNWLHSNCSSLHGF